MGYALFASRKIMYTNLIASLQQKLDNIQQRKNDLITYSATISDGKVTVDELAGDSANFSNYMEFAQGLNAYMNTPDAEGGAATTINQIGSQAATQSQDPAYLQSIAESINTSVSEKYAKQIAKKIEIQENQLDMEQKKIETQLSKAERELEAVEQAEGQAIQRSTPKYDGVG